MCWSAANHRGWCSQRSNQRLVWDKATDMGVDGMRLLFATITALVTGWIGMIMMSHAIAGSIGMATIDSQTERMCFSRQMHDQAIARRDGVAEHQQQKQP